MRYIGVDLGGTNISVGIVNEDGEVIKKYSTPTLIERGSDAVIKDIYLLCEKLINENDVDEIKTIGVGSPGTVDSENGIILFSSNLSFKDFNIKARLKSLVDSNFTGLDIFVENDANCAALGENMCGAAKGCKNSITITLGTGVGGGVILGGKILKGSFCGGTEIGHTVIVANGEECSCGRKGCWEAYSSATALIREARVVAAKHPDSLIFEMVGGDIRQIDAKISFQAAENGDERMKVVIKNYYKYLAIGIANLINIFEPEVVAIGGGISGMGEKLTKPVTEYAKEMVYGRNMQTRIEIAKLGNDAGIVGAAMLGRC